MLLHVLVCTAASCPWWVAHNETLALAGGSPTTYRNVPTNAYLAEEWHVCPSPPVCSWEFSGVSANWHKFCRTKHKSETGFGGPGPGCCRYGYRFPALGLLIGVSEWGTPLGQRGRKDRRIYSLCLSTQIPVLMPDCDFSDGWFSTEKAQRSLNQLFQGHDWGRIWYYFPLDPRRDKVTCYRSLDPVQTHRFHSFTFIHNLFMDQPYPEALECPVSLLQAPKWVSFKFHSVLSNSHVGQHK